MSQILRDLTQISRSGVQYRADKLAPMGLKGCHSSYLVAICNHPGISQDKLARRILINKSNVARQVANLEEDGFIRRVPSEADKRVMELYPTQKALDLLPQLREILNQWENFITEDLTEEERAQLAVILSKMKPRAASYMEDR